jgi:hypothetical protein
VREALGDAVGHREAVDDHADPGPVLVEQRERLVVGRAGVDHERLGEGASELDLGDERTPLILGRRPVAVVVQAGLADRHAVLIGGLRLQLGVVGVVEPGRCVGVTADGCVDLVEPGGGSERRPAGGAVGSDREHAAHPRRHRGLHQLRVRRLTQVQMGVTVDHRPAQARAAGRHVSSAGYRRGDGADRPA